MSKSDIAQIVIGLFLALLCCIPIFYFFGDATFYSRLIIAFCTSGAVVSVYGFLQPIVNLYYKKRPNKVSNYIKKHIDKRVDE